MKTRVFSTVVMLAVAMATWADNVIASQTKWTFNDYSIQSGTVYEYQNLYLHGGSVFSTDDAHVASTSGTFSGTSESWSATKVLVSNHGFDMSAVGNIGADSNDAPAGSLAFSHSGSGMLYVVYGAASTTDGKFTVAHKKTAETAYTTLAEQNVPGIAYSGSLGAPQRAGSTYQFTQQQAKVALSGSGTVYLGSSQAYCVYAILFVPVQVEKPSYTVDDSKKDQRVFTIIFGEKQKLYFQRPQDDAPKSQSYKEAFAETPYTLTITQNGLFEFWVTESVSGNTLESEHTTIVIDNLVKKPTVAFTRVEGENSVFTISFVEGETLHYTLPGSTEEKTVDTGSSVEVTVTIAGMLTAYTTRGDAESDHLETGVYTPTTAIESNGSYDFKGMTMIADYIPIILESDVKTTIGETAVFAPAALTARTFNNKFAFTPVIGNGWRFRKDYGIMVEKNREGSMAILGMKKGQSIKFDLGGVTSVINQTTAVIANEEIVSGTTYTVAQDGDLLLKIGSADVNSYINKVSIVSQAEKSEAATYDFMARLANGGLQFNDQEPITIYVREAGVEKKREDFQTITTFDDKIAVRLGASGVTERTKDNITTYRFTRPFAIRNVGQGDEIIIRYIGGGTLLNVTPNESVNGALFSIDNEVVVVDGGEVASGSVVMVTNAFTPDNYIVLQPSGEVDVISININTPEVETVTAPTITMKSESQITIRSGASTMGHSVTTYYTTDGTVPTMESASFTSKKDVTLQETTKVNAITFSESGANSSVTSLTWSVADGTIAAVDFTDSDLSLTGDRTTHVMLKDIPAEMLIYLPATSDVSGINVVTKQDDGSFVCNDYQITDGKACGVPYPFNAVAAKINRQFVADKKCTVCLPYDLPAVGGTFYMFTGVEDGKVKMTQQTGTLQANTPYIFIPNENVSELAATNVVVSISDAPQTVNEAAQFSFIGTFRPIVWDAPIGIYGFAAEEDGISTVGQFVRVGSGASIAACRAYLMYTGEEILSDVKLAARRSQTAMPERMNILWIAADGSVTGVSQITNRRQETMGSQYYNLAGQRVDGNYKGLVICNGKKVIK